MTHNDVDPVDFVYEVTETCYWTIPIERWTSSLSSRDSVEKLALDDFGTAFLLSFVRACFPFDILKLGHFLYL